MKLVKGASKRHLMGGPRSAFNDSESCVSSVNDVHFKNADFVNKALSYEKLLEEYEIQD